MTTFIKGLRKLMRILYRILSAMLVLLVLAMTVIMTMQIVMRATGMQSFKWSEEVLRYLYIWTVFLGVPAAIYTNDLTRFDLIQTKLSPRAGRLLETVIIIIMLIVLYFMCQGSLTLIRVQMRQTMTSLNLPMGIVYLSMPICAVCSAMFFLARLLLMWSGQPDLAEDAGQAGDPEKEDGQ